jgi:hypothetical protein
MPVYLLVKGDRSINFCENRLLLEEVEQFESSLTLSKKSLIVGDTKCPTTRRLIGCLLYGRRCFIRGFFGLGNAWMHN